MLMFLVSCSKMTIIIGVSLSEPHTSGTSLRRCVCIYMTDRPCLRPYTVNFKCTFKYFPKIERPHGNVLGCWSAALATVAKTAPGFKDAWHLHICHSRYGLAINGRLLADRTANHFSVKLSLFMCMLAACSGSPPKCSTISSYPVPSYPQNPPSYKEKQSGELSQFLTLLHTFVTSIT